MAHWSDEYPHSLYASVSLNNNKITGWKISNQIMDWSSRNYGGGIVEYTEFIVNNQEEHDNVFEKLGHDWFKQWEITDNYQGSKPY